MAAVILLPVIVADFGLAEHDEPGLGTVDAGLPVAQVAMAIVATLRGVAMQLLLDPEDTDLAVAQQTVATVVQDAVRRR